MRYRDISDDIKQLSEIFIANGFELYLVGGAVRDCLLGIKNSDFDFATDAKPDDVQRLFKNVIPTGIKHGTVTVLFKGRQYEITTFRTEAAYSDCRHPDDVRFVSDLAEDLKRRDFTINAFACRLPDGRIIDMHNGRKDLRRKKIRAIGDPRERFGEDALRMMRACRFSAKLAFDIEENTLCAVKKMAKNINLVSAERIQEEFSKTLMSDNPLYGLTAMIDTGLADEILPEFMKCEGVEQLGIHDDDVMRHSLTALQIACDMQAELPLRLAALFHDIGKPETSEFNGERYTFHGHENVSAGITENILRRLKYSNAIIGKTVTLVKNHMFNYTSNWSDGAVRRLINRVGADNIEDLLKLRVCDANAIDFGCSTESVNELYSRIQELDTQAMDVNSLDIKGGDLVGLGLTPGPVFAKIKNSLLERVLDDPSLNEHGKLVEMAKEIIAGFNL